jgi:hypothetical protein
MRAAVVHPELEQLLHRGCRWVLRGCRRAARRLGPQVLAQTFDVAKLNLGKTRHVACWAPGTLKGPIHRGESSDSDGRKRALYRAASHCPWQSASPAVTAAVCVKLCLAGVGSSAPAAATARPSASNVMSGASVDCSGHCFFISISDCCHRTAAIGPGPTGRARPVTEPDLSHVVMIPSLVRVTHAIMMDCPRPLQQQVGPCPWPAPAKGMGS